MQSRFRGFLLALVTSFSIQGLAFSALDQATNCTISQNPNFCPGRKVVNGNSISVSCVPLHTRYNKPSTLALLSCRNCEILKRTKPAFNGSCDPANSRGYKASQVCEGKSYLCIFDGVATCYTSFDVVANLGASNGECFF